LDSPVAPVSFGLCDFATARQNAREIALAPPAMLPAAAQSRLVNANVIGSGME